MTPEKQYEAEFFYCKKCNSGFYELLEVHPNDPSKLKPIVRCFGKTGGELFTGRKLSCNHFIDYASHPIPDPAAPSPEFATTIGQLLPEKELQELRSLVMSQVSKMSEEELQKHILEHYELFALHMKAQSKEKYIVQLVKSEIDKRKREGKLSPSQIQEFEYLDRKMTKREYLDGEKIVKEQVKTERKAKEKRLKADSSIEKMYKALANTKGSLSLEEIKARLEGK